MSTLYYKDYQGSVAFEDGRLVIQILHIEDSVSATCDLASEAQATFEVLVDDYIETFNVRIGPELHRQAALAAADAGETLNAWVIGAAQERLRRAHGRGGAGGKDRA